MENVTTTSESGVVREATDRRYPYTHAADYLREATAEWGEVAGTKMRLPSISRGQAAGVRSAISKVLGLDDYEVACKLADAFLARAPTHDSRSTEEPR